MQTIESRFHKVAPPNRFRDEIPSGERAGHLSNNFNFVRLFLAASVLLSHSTALVDGNRNREVLFRIFHTATLGEFAVYGFFLLSGYLIVQSWQRNPRVSDFITNRILRIYPAFVVASLFSVFVVGSIGSDAPEYFSRLKVGQLVKELLLLEAPTVPPVFKGQPFPVINGSLWTIGYEFRCYVLAALLGVCGLVNRRRWWLALSVTTMVSVLVWTLPHRLPSNILNVVLNDPSALLMFLALFGIGGSICLFRDRLRFETRWVVTAIVLLLPCMFQETLAKLGLATLGAYVLFAFAFASISILDRFKTFPDISYGVYLYGWPIQKLLMHSMPELAPWSLFVLTCGASCCFGLASCYIVERPFLSFKQTRRGSLRTTADRAAEDEVPVRSRAA